MVFSSVNGLRLEPLAGRVAVVTGAAGGIGRVIALSLANAGVKVGLGDIRLERLEEVVKEIKVKGGQALGVKTNVIERQQVKNLVAETEKALGPVDILVNNAGYYYFTLMTSLMEDTWEKSIDTNCKGVMNAIGAVLGGMVARGRGHILSISADSGKIADPGMTVYSGTQFFVEGMSQALRQEVAQHGIRVTTIQPGYVNTQGVHASFEKEADEKYNFGKDITMLTEQQVADTVIYALSQPSNVSISELMVQPVTQYIAQDSTMAKHC